MAKRYDAIARGRAIPDGVEPATERASRLRAYLEQFECVRETKFVEAGSYESPEVIATVVEDDDGPGGTTNSELWDASDNIRSELLDLWASHSATYTRRDEDDVPPVGTVYKGYYLVEPWRDDPEPDEVPRDRLTWFHTVVFRHDYGRPDYLYGSSGTFEGIDSLDDSTLLLDDVPEEVSSAVEWSDVIAVGLKDTRNIVCRGPAFEAVAERYDDQIAAQAARR